MTESPMAMEWMAADTVVGGAVAAVAATVVGAVAGSGPPATVVGVTMGAGGAVVAPGAATTGLWSFRALWPALMLCSTAPAWGLASASPTTLTTMAIDRVPATQRVVRRRRWRSAPFDRYSLVAHRRTAPRRMGPAPGRDEGSARGRVRSRRRGGGGPGREGTSTPGRVRQ